MIYAIHASGTKAVKFGVTRNMERRLAAHQVSCPLKLVVLAVVDWPNHAELRIHNLLRRQCIRGEWFKYDGLAISIIDAMLAGADASVLDSLSVQPSQHRLDRVTQYALEQSWPSFVENLQ